LTADFNGNNKVLSKRCDSNADAFNNSAGEEKYAFNVNERLLSSLDAAKDENASTKELVQKEQGQYMAAAESRLELQRTLAYILNCTQGKLTDAKLSEDMFARAHLAQAEAKATMDALETNYS